MVKLAIGLLMLFGISLGQVIDYLNCPSVEIVEDFDLTAFLGTWHHYSRYWDFTRVGTRCNTATYSMRPNGSIDILDENIYIATAKHQKMKGIVNLGGNGTEGILEYSYPPSTGHVGEYLILGTDYKNWATLWSCLGIDTVGSVRFVFIYTRDVNPSEEVINATLTVLEKFQIPTDILITESQEDCTAESET